MASRQIDERRIRLLNEREVNGKGDYVLYWMQHSQRAEHNEALELAIQRANQHQVPVLVAFALDENYPDASERHYRFMLQGIVETSAAIQRRKLGFVLRRGSPPEVAADLAGRAVEVVTDRGYLRHHRQWRADLAIAVEVRLTQVECDLVVPVETASDKREYAARTIRSKIQDAANHFLKPLATTPVDVRFTLDVHGERIDDADHLLKSLSIDRRVKAVDWIRGGTSSAKQRLRQFIENDLVGYDQARSDVNSPQVSQLSPYLHYGMISPIDVALQIRDAKRRETEDTAGYLEELLVRRELAHNFVFYARADYDQFRVLPDWARDSLEIHQDDPRDSTFTAEELEEARTDDDVWNASMIEMRESGYLHNQLRMYWGKKFLEWTNTPQYAYRVLLQLNNRYFLDGRDANSYANVGWIFGLHDRPYQERPIYGKVRYLSRHGLDRKFDPEAYVRSRSK